MKEIKEEALIKYFQVVSDYCNRIVDFINTKYETNINDVCSKSDMGGYVINGQKQILI